MRRCGPRFRLRKTLYSTLGLGLCVDVMGSMLRVGVHRTKCFGAVDEMPSTRATVELGQLRERQTPRRPASPVNPRELQRLCRWGFAIFRIGRRCTVAESSDEIAWCESSNHSFSPLDWGQFRERKSPHTPPMLEAFVWEMINFRASAHRVGCQATADRHHAIAPSQYQAPTSNGQNQRQDQLHLPTRPPRPSFVVVSHSPPRMQAKWDVSLCRSS